MPHEGEHPPCSQECFCSSDMQSGYIHDQSYYPAEGAFHRLFNCAIF